MKTPLSFAAILLSAIFVVASTPLPPFLGVHPRDALSSWAQAAYGNGVWVVVSSSGQPEIMLSQDGVTWTTAAVRHGIDYNRVLFAEGRFWTAGGDDDSKPYILSSENGADWSLVAYAPGEWISPFEYSAGTWLARYDSEDGSPGILVSTNGTRWSAVSPTPPIYKFAGLDGRWVAQHSTSNTMLGSTNGTEWFELGPLPGFTWAADMLHGLTTGHGRYFAFGGKRAMDAGGYHSTPYLSTSVDGSNWVNGVITSPPMRDSVTRSIACGSNGCVALLAQYSRTSYGFISSEVLTSDDGGVTWSPHPLPYTTSLNAVSYGDGRYIITGAEGIILSSADGVNWQRVAGASTRHIRDMDGYSTTCVAVGDGGLILSSRNGRTWQRHDNISGADLVAVTGYRGGWIAVGGSTQAVVLRANRSASVWTEMTLPGAGLRAIESSGNDFVAVGLKGTVTRISAETAESTTVPGTPDFRSLASFRGCLYAIARPDPLPGYPPVIGESQVLQSCDGGASWEIKATQAKPLQSLASNDRVIIAVGQGGTALYSTDGAEWQRASVPGGMQLHSIAAGRGIFLAAGDEGKLVWSRNGSQWNEIGYESSAFGSLYQNIWYRTTIYGRAPWVAFARHQFYAGPGLEYIVRSAQNGLPYEAER